MDPATLTILMAASTVMKAGGQIRQGYETEYQMRASAALDERQAEDTLAAASRRALEEDRRGRLVQSRALAVAAASGGGASDPTVMNLIADLAGESAYRRSVEMYQGEAEADRLRYIAGEKKRQGKGARKAGLISAGATLLGGAKSMYENYSTPGPQTSAGGYSGYGDTSQWYGYGG